MRLTIADVIAATGARKAGSVDDAIAFEAVSTDSRRDPSGALFVALRGERFDGHDFVPRALQENAVAVLVERVIGGTEIDSGARQLIVPDTVRALGDLAAYVRRRLSTRVVGITGSNGKTTTKEMVAAICVAACGSRDKVLKTEGNLNNLIGLPLTLLKAVGNEEVGVLEMGMNQPGEIARMTEIAQPDFAVVTNVGRAHLERLGSLAGVAAAKGELYAGLPNESAIAVNLEDDWVRRIAEPFRGRRVTYGSGGDVRAESVRDQGLDGIEFDLVIANDRRGVRLPHVGAHNVSNALAAAAVTHAMGIPIDEIATGLGAPPVAAMRMQVFRLESGVTVINDAYNANPDSTEAALRATRRLPGRSVVVLGDMWELGDGSGGAHREVGARAAALGIDELFAVGAHAEDTCAGARSAGMDASHAHAFASVDALADALLASRRPGDVMLVKGSRGMRMEEVVRRLMETEKGAA